jgi:hypothetical protein
MFRALSLIIAAICLLKGFTGLLWPRQFYQWRHVQYTSQRMPPIVLVAPVVIALLVAIAWYGTLTANEPFSWIVTGFISVAFLLAFVNLSRWSRHRNSALQAVESPQKRMAVDLTLVGIGLGFVVLAKCAY